MNVWVGSLFIASVICSILEVTHQKELSNISAIYISSLQSSNIYLIDLFFMFLEIFTAAIFICVSIFMYYCYDRLLGVQALFLGISSASLASFLKICFASPRPFWEFAYVRSISCPKDFGYPSGHSFSAGGVIYFLTYHWLQKGKNKGKIILCSGLLLFIVGLDRNYMGVHHVLQVVSGNLYSALWVSVILHANVREKVKNIFSTVNGMVFLHCFWGIFIGIALLVYSLRNGEMKGEWVHNYKIKCGKELSYDAALLKGIDECILVSFVVGLSFGYFLSFKTDVASFTLKNIIFSSIFLLIFGGCYIVLEKSLKYLMPSGLFLVLFVGLRYGFGVLAGYFVPIYLYRLSKKSDELMKRSHLEQIELNQQ